MRVLNVFVDESGVYGPYERHSPYYIVTLVLHDQAIDISDSVNTFSRKMIGLGLSEAVIHSGRLIRREFEYRDMLLLERKRIFNVVYNFSRTVDVKYHTFAVEKWQIADDVDLTFRLTKQLSSFLHKHLEALMKYDRIVVYYDYGQNQLTKLLITSFNTALTNVDVRKTKHTDYKLFQVADMFCTLELLSMKAEHNQLSKSELAFFKTAKAVDKSYLRAIQSKRF